LEVGQPLPVFPDKQTFSVPFGMSHRCTRAEVEYYSTTLSALANNRHPHPEMKASQAEAKRKAA
jgi:hypothetical protein